MGLAAAAELGTDSSDLERILQVASWVGGILVGVSLAIAGNIDRRRRAALAAPPPAVALVPEAA